MSAINNHHCSAPATHTGNPLAEQKSRWVVAISFVMMIAEIFGGWLTNSMALLADGWHMSSHVLALGLALFAYIAARRYADDPRFCFGTWKIEILASFTSALSLIVVALLMLWQSLERLLQPQPIAYGEAMAIALLGLVINLISAWLLHGAHPHHDDHHQPNHEHHEHHEHHGDLNLRAAYLHVLADAATSISAIVALLAGSLWGADWLDPLMGVAGAFLVGYWALGLLRETAKILLDAEMDAPLVNEVRALIDAAPEELQLHDLHLWRVAANRYACIITLEAKQPINGTALRQRLSAHPQLSHITVEIRGGDGEQQ